MAKLVFLSLLVLSCVTFVSCRSASSIPPPVSPQQFVNNSCMNNTDGQAYDMCSKDLAPFANDFKGDDKSLAMKALSISADKVKASINLVKKLKTDKKAPTTDAGKSLDSCTMALLQAAEQISWAEGSLKSAGQKSTSINSSNIIKEKVGDWLFDARENSSTCVSAMEGFRDTNWGNACDNVDETSNTITYASQLVATHLSKATPPLPPANWTDFIRRTCGSFDTNYGSQWQHDMLALVPKGATMDNVTLTYVAVNVSVRNTDSLLDSMNQMIDSKNHNTTQKDRQGARKCATELHKAFAPLDKAAHRDPKSLSDLPGFLQGFNVSGSDCLTLVRAFEGYANNALYLANYAQTSNNLAIYLVNDHLKSKGKN